MKKIISLLMVLCICCVVTCADEIYGKVDQESKGPGSFVWNTGYYGNVYEFWNLKDSAWIFCRDKNNDKFTFHWYIVELSKKYDSLTNTGTLTLSNPEIIGFTDDGMFSSPNALTGFFAVPSKGKKVFFYRIYRGKNNNNYLCFVPCNNSANYNYDLYTAYDMDRVFDSATDKLYIDLGDREYSLWLY